MARPGPDLAERMEFGGARHSEEAVPCFRAKAITQDKSPSRSRNPTARSSLANSPHSSTYSDLFASPGLS